MLVLSLATWQHQYERMQRSFAKVQKTAHRSSIDYDDDVLHFFMDCWHLREWIQNDRALGLDKRGKEAVSQECNNHLALRIAADLANGLKHPVRTQQPKEGAKVMAKHVVFALGRGDLTVTHEVRLDDGTVTTAQAVAADACVAWGAVLASLGLDPAPPA